MQPPTSATMCTRCRDCGNGKSKPHHWIISKRKTSLGHMKHNSNNVSTVFIFKKLILVCDNWQSV